MSTLSNFVIKSMQDFSPEDMAAFTAEFEKLQKPVAICKPKKIKPKRVSLTIYDCIRIKREQYSIQAQGNLHNSLEVPERV